MKFGFVITGAKELDANLKTLPDRMQKKVIRQAVREGQRPMLSAAKANARSMVGGQMGRLIANALQIRAPKKQRRGSYSLHVQFKSGVEEFSPPPKRGGKRHFIPAAIEYGHLAGGTYVPPISFGRSAAEATRNESLQRFTERLRTGLLREAILSRNP